MEETLAPKPAGPSVPPVEKTRVAYLFGAGATHAVMSSLNSEWGLLTSHIQDEILKLSEGERKVDVETWNELTVPKVDVEHLISVLESQYKYPIVEMLRKHYRDAIVKLSQKVSTASLPGTLYGVLMEMHSELGPRINEDLACLITLNYEDILERTVELHSKCPIDYVFDAGTATTDNSVKLFKLHGSFGWSNTRPIGIESMDALKDQDALWIPPSVDKRKDNYPFNLLWGSLMEELTGCDVLRVVGCSLSRNDWGLIPLLYTVQTFNQTNPKKIRIELIDFPDTAETVRETYKYLNVVGLAEIPEVLAYFGKQIHGEGNKQAVQDEVEEMYKSRDKANPLSDWLSAKIENYIYQNKEEPRTIESQILRRFYHKASD